jgi:hypothetical protein
MPEIGGLDLGKKVGPFPVGVWIAAVGGGLALAYFMNRTLASGISGDSGGGTAVEPGVGGTPGGFIPAPQPGDESAEEDDSILDNEMWAFRATAFLVVEGYNAVDVGVAIRRYLDGEQISSADASMIQAAVNELGPPPTIPVGGGIIKPPTPKPPASQPPPSTVTKPGAPKLRIASRWSSAIQIEWSPVPGATKYELQRTKPTKGMVVATDGSEYIMPLLKSKTKYTFQVRSVNSAGKSGWASITTTTT